MISFVAENYELNYSLYAKSPRHKLKNKVITSDLQTLIIKLLTSGSINSRHTQAFWGSFSLLSYSNRSTKVLGLSLSYYYTYLANILPKNTKIKANHCPKLSLKSPLTSLPIYKSTNNQALFFILNHTNAHYSPLYSKQRSLPGYSDILPMLKLYNNVNFYFLKVYEH